MTYEQEKEKLELALNKPVQISKDIEQAEKIFKKHVGFEKEKETFLSHIKLYLITQGNFWPVKQVICYASAPGMGKTTFVQNVAQAMGRPCQTVSLAGFKQSPDYSVLGNDRSKPGLVTWAIIKSGCKNPVILLDELEKAEDSKIQKELIQLFKDYKEGKKIKDEYFDKEIDLSQVTFFATVNYLEGLAPALKNEVGVNRLPDFSRDEKKKILEMKAEEINDRHQKKIITEKFIEELIEHIQEPGIRQEERVLYKVEESYIYSQTKGEEFSVAKNPKQWLKENVFAYKEEFKPTWKHYLLFIFFGVNLLLMASWIFGKFVLKDKTGENNNNHE